MRIICITPFEKHDYLTDCIVQGLRELGHELINTDSGNGFRDTAGDDYILSQAKEADAVLAFWSKRQAPAPRFHLLDQIDGIPKAYIDGSEYNQVGHPRKPSTWLNHEMLGGKADFYFKRECLESDIVQGVMPLPFAARQSDFEIPIGTYPKHLDIMCAFGQTKMDPIRGQLQSRLAALGDHSRILASAVPNDQYKILTASSKICVNAHGGGEDCMRFWEIVAAGAVCFTQKFNIIMPHPYTDGWNMIEFESADEFIDKSQQFLQYPEMLERIALAGYEHTKKYHTTKARAQYIIDNMGLANV